MSVGDSVQVLAERQGAPQQWKQPANGLELSQSVEQ